ncbi:MAG: hypothetical protein IJ859_04080 [Synergistaceae bacterium]|nr:hypothetical protein [Synergistaceae bacterium]
MAKKIFGYGDFYCWKCGKNVEKGHTQCPFCGAFYDKFDTDNAIGAGGVGWSTQVNHPSFAAWHGRNKKTFQICMIILSLIIGVILFIIPGELDFDAEGLKIYSGVLAIVWTIDLVWYYFNNKTRKDWEGVVENKETEEYTRKTKENNGNVNIEYHTRFIIKFRKDDGGSEKLTELDRPSWFDYLNEGDRVRYHGNKGMNYYEKYDKSNDDIIPCAGCGAARDARENFCGRCGCIILKTSRN